MFVLNNLVKGSYPSNGSFERCIENIREHSTDVVNLHFASGQIRVDTPVLLLTQKSQQHQNLLIHAQLSRSKILVYLIF